MKKYLSILFVLIIVLVGVSGCKKEAKKKEQLNLNKMQEISEFSTVKAIYHNVAKIEKKPGKGIQHWGEVTRYYWIEYTGWATIGVKFSDAEIKINKNHITITMPHAEILQNGEDNYDENSIFKTKDGWFNKNEVTKNDINDAIKEANDKMLEKVKNDSSLFKRAENNTEALIKNYINEIGKIYNEKYEVEFIYK
jgi:hypothetical protein